MKTESLQWGGRFSAPPDEELLGFGSSLADDMPLAAFDVACSRAHVAALDGGGIISDSIAHALHGALAAVASEINSGDFAAYAAQSGAEDIHGAIDRRVREHCVHGDGDWLHAGRSRNDQVATTLLMYTNDRARRGRQTCVTLLDGLLARARTELHAQSHLAAVTHWQPAQPMLLAFWLAAVAEMVARSARRFAAVETEAMKWCPLGSSAVTGSTLPLDRRAACALLGFGAPSRNAMDAIGTRDVALDLLHAVARALSDAGRVCNEIVLWATPAFGYVRLGDPASTGSSLMPQKRNPDPFELVRAQAAAANAAYGGAVSTLQAIPLSYHRDLQVTKSIVINGSERGLAALSAFQRAFEHVGFCREKMAAHAGDGFTTATDEADALILTGASAKAAHAQVGARILKSEGIGESSLGHDALQSIHAKRTIGSTNPMHVLAAIDALAEETDDLR